VLCLEERTEVYITSAANLFDFGVRLRQRGSEGGGKTQTQFPPELLCRGERAGAIVLSPKTTLALTGRRLASSRLGSKVAGSTPLRPEALLKPLHLAQRMKVGEQIPGGTI